MPHINRIRVNNVKYNFGTQYYDDFMMRFSGKNTIYDLANGGGKSVLMLLLMQNLIPNCTLDEKQPIEKLFRTNQGNTVIHSMVEWILGDAHIRDGFKYMLTGFCARRAKDSGEENLRNTAEIEYFNYCIFYKKYNDNDIKNLPLTRDGERVTYSGLKNYLKDLERKDFNVEVHIFERKGDYQKFISRYGLYESHWEIIRGINKTEGHVRTYFETNYKTTRKVVEDLLIEEIIQKSFQNKYGNEEEQSSMAKTLLDIKDKLLELSKKKNELHNYDRQMTLLKDFSDRIQGIKQLYIGMDELETEISKAYNTVIREESEKKRERVTAADRKAYVTDEKRNLSRRVETAKVMKKANELDGYKIRLKEYSDIIAGEQEKEDRLRKELIVKESGNDYLEYIYYKQEYDRTREMLDYSMKDKNSLTDELKALTSAWKKYCDERTQEIDDILAHESEILSQEQKNIDEYGSRTASDVKEMAVLEFRLDDCRTKKEKISEMSLEARNNSGILLPAMASEELKKTDEAIAEKTKILDELTAHYEQIEKQRKEYINTRQNIDITLDNLNDKLKWHMDRLSENMEKQKKIDAICRVYGEADYNNLDAAIRNALRDKIRDIGLIRDKKELLEKRLDARMNGKAFEEPGNVAAVMDYIERYHGDKAKTGLDYLKNTDEDVRNELLEKFPILPYSIVVTDGFDELSGDSRICETVAGMTPVVMINESALTKETFVNDIYDSEKLIYIVDDTWLTENEDKRLQNIKELEDEISKLCKEADRKAETESVMEDDYALIAGASGLVGERENLSKQIEDIKYNIKLNESKIEGLMQDSQEWDTILADTGREMEQIRKSLSEKQKQKSILEEVKKYYEEIKKIDAETLRVSERLEELRKNNENVRARADALKRQMENRKQKMETLSGEKDRLNKEWKEIYEPYYSSDIAPYETEDVTQLKARLDGVVEAVATELSGLKDKQKLLNNYSVSMEKTLQRIRYKGQSAQEYEKLYAAGELSEVSEQILGEIKNQAEDIRKNIDKYTQLEREMSSKCDRLEGNIANAVQVISEKYGYYEEESIEADDVDIFISENDAMLNEYVQEIKKTDETLAVLDNDINRLTMIKKDIENRMEMEGISLKETDDYYERGTDIESKSRDIIKKYEKFRNDVRSRREDFIHEKQLLEETMRSAGGEAMAEEIRANVDMPESSTQTDELTEMLAETVRCLELEKDMVGRGIEDMEKIKENFESQCLQNCLNIKTELERLPKLSRIVMDGENISMINLRIPYKSPEVYKGQMSEYIDETARNADELESTDERIKYIRSRLSWKKLFAVIVTDMNAIKLNLYKRERIKEQSRYLPYEEAVGSTGQSQGIYIQFLVSVINYISSINSKNADTSGTGKVIFIDNPFGAAKDVYIWEPIFKLLKTNNVQLIVPARGATPAITGRFDVNYVLGQKLVGNRQQTVVTDYFSNIENEEIEYTKMSYEQTSLF